MDAEKNIMADLIGKYLAGEANPDEAMQLEAWLKDPGNHKEYEEYVRLWNLMPASVGAKVPAHAEVWSQLQSNMDKREYVPIRKLVLRLTVAASIIAVIAIAAVYFVNQQRGDSYRTTETNALVHEAKGEKRTDTLNDGSVVTVNKYSMVSYAPDFNDVTRELSMSGEAFFNVKPDKTKPFIISVDDLKIEVVGTSFNVRSLRPQHEIEVQVQTGIVKMYTQNQSLMVKKGQTGTYIKKDGTLKLTDSIDVNKMGYATNSFYFNDISLTEACKYLAHAFNVEIKIDEDKFSDCRLTAQFDNKSVSYILEVINATFNTTYKKDGNIITINGNGCK